MTRVAVTTAHDSASRVGNALVAHDLVPIMLPCISISPSPEDVLEELRSEAKRSDLILVTSARAVRITWPGRDMPNVPVAAVGPASAEAVEHAGGSVEIVGSGGAGELVDLLEPDGMTILFPHAHAADPATAATLAERGATVVARPAYTTIPIAPDDTKVDAAVFGSPTAINGWMLRRHLDDMPIGAMGSTTATALRVRGVESPIVAKSPGIEALAAALAKSIGG